MRSVCPNRNALHCWEMLKLVCFAIVQCLSTRLRSRKAKRKPVRSVSWFPAQLFWLCHNFITRFKTKKQCLFLTASIQKNFTICSEILLPLWLTYLQLSLDPSFASLPKGHLGLVVLRHDLHKFPGQHSMLRRNENTRPENEEKMLKGQQREQSLGVN